MLARSARSARSAGSAGSALRVRPARSIESAGSRLALQRRLFSEWLVPVHNALETAHAASGLSWPVFIPLATFGLRLTLTTPLSIVNRLRARKQARLASLLSAMVPVYKAQLAAGAAAKHHTLTAEQISVLAAKERRKQRVGLYKEFKCQNWRMLMLPVVQVPLFIAMSLTLRAMCGWTMLEAIPIEEQFTEQGIAWLPSLSRPDPYGVVPLAVGACSFANAELNARATVPAKSGPSMAAALANMARFGSLMFMVLSFEAPTAIGLYWLSSNAFSLVQTALLDHYLPIKQVPDYPDTTVSAETDLSLAPKAVKK